MPGRIIEDTGRYIQSMSNLGWNTRCWSSKPWARWGARRWWFGQGRAS